MLRLLREALRTRKIRYLIAGGWNTLFGYVAGVVLYYLMRDRFHLVVIAALGNVIAITMAFATYKVFVFRTRGNWLSEYLRSHVVYGGTAVFGIALLWALVDGAGLHFWIAQAVVIAITVIASYIGHARFTFGRNAS